MISKSCNVRDASQLISMWSGVRKGYLKTSYTGPGLTSHHAYSNDLGQMLPSQLLVLLSDNTQIFSPD